MGRFCLAIILCFGPLSSQAGGQFEQLVDGVTAVGAGQGSVACSLYASTPDWVTVACGGESHKFPHATVMAAEIDAGAVIAYGHPGFLRHASHLDNGTHLANVAGWVDRLGTGRAAYSTGHSEGLSASHLSGFATILAANGNSLEALPAPISAASLEPYSVLIVASASDPFSNDELDAIEAWVRSGGGLILTGLGWAFIAYNGSGLGIDDYPMNILGSRFGIRWLKGYATETNPDPDVGATYESLYPDAFDISLDGAMATLTNLHQTEPSTLIGQVESDVLVRLPFAWSHLTLAIAVTDLPMAHPDRDRIYGFYTSLVQSQPEFYARTAIIDSTATPTVVHVRERFWKTFVDLLPLDSIITEEIISNGALSEQRADLLRSFDLIVLDNQRMATNQLGFIHDIYYLMPPEVVKPAAISANGFFGTSTVPIHLRGTRPGVNTFTSPLNGPSANQFPSDVEPGIIPSFCGATSHEICHVVRGQTIRNDPALEIRHDQLIADAGDEPMNYLRSMIAPGFFTNAPQEFFASIANQYFADSTKTLDLGVLRFQNGYLLPINQALFFMDVCSESTEWTPLFFTSTQGEITRHWAILDRDVNSRITGVAIDIRQFTFSYSSADNVISINESPSMRCNRVDITTQGASPLSPEYLMPDRLISGADLLLFVNLWVLEDARADMTTQGAPIGSMEHGVPDGLVSGADIQFYVNLWVAGCP